MPPHYPRWPLTAHDYKAGCLPTQCPACSPARLLACSPSLSQPASPKAPPQPDHHLRLGKPSLLPIQTSTHPPHQLLSHPRRICRFLSISRTRRFGLGSWSSFAHAPLPVPVCSQRPTDRPLPLHPHTSRNSLHLSHSSQPHIHTHTHRQNPHHVRGHITVVRLARQRLRSWRSRRFCWPRRPQSQRRQA